MPVTVSACPPPEEDESPMIIPFGSIDRTYERKAHLLNRAIQSIGMGRYQWQLFAIVSFGWASDNLWPITTSYILAPLAAEFSTADDAKRAPMIALAQNFGLLFGAIFWGFGCDVFGRRWGFALTLGCTAVFGLAAAGSPSFAAAGVFAALWSFGVGGNLPVDSAVLLEVLPASHQYLLTVLSAAWAIAGVVAGLMAWPLLGGFSCPASEALGECKMEDNMGWRYFLLVMGGLTMAMFGVRFAAFKIHESPKFLIGKGRDEDAVRVVHEIALMNGTSSTLSLADLRACEELPGSPAASKNEEPECVSTELPLNKRQLLLELVSLSRVRVLFSTRSLALSTSIVTLVWALLGLAYPLYNSFLPYIQAQRGVSFGDGSPGTTYRNTLIVNASGVPGALLGGWLVELPRLGRKGTLAVASVVTGVFLYGSTTASTSDTLLGWNCAFAFGSNVMYAVLYSFTPELFPTPQRGTGNSLTATANRVFGIMAPIVAMYGDLETSVPVYVSGGLFIVAGLLVLVLPFESRGKAAL